MLAHIITIGDEILIGQIVDTNSAWIAEQLHLNGIQVRFMASIPDTSEAIQTTLDSSFAEADLILMTGGLGPTKDDVTKQTLARYFNTGMYRDQIVLEHVKSIFARSNKPMLAINEQQADVLACSDVLFNAQGTAPGMWIEHHGKLLVIMPGVPFEMKHLMQVQVLPRLAILPGKTSLWHHTMLTAGLGESFLAQQISEIEDSLPSHIQLAYLPQPGAVRLRLSAKGQDVERLQQQTRYVADQIQQKIGLHFIAHHDVLLQEVLLQRLELNQKNLILAESCTGGYLSHLFTRVPGSSAAFAGSLVTYSNQLKRNVLGVSAETLEQFGAVSEETVIEMAQGALRVSGADYALSISGIAGPTGGVPGKEVGMVWVAIASKEEPVHAQMFKFGTDRFVNIQRASQAAMYLLWQRLNQDQRPSL